MPSSSSSSPSPALSASPSTPADNPPMDSVPGGLPLIEVPDSVPGGRPLIELPAGFYFFPIEEDMALLLSRKVSGQPLLDYDLRRIHPPRDVDVSQFEPEDLPRNDEKYRRHLSTFFTTRTNDVQGGGRPSRPTPRGCWKAAHKGDRRIVSDRGDAVGFKRMFIYYQGKAPNEVKTFWAMREVRLNPRCQQYQNLDPQKMQSCVICTVYNYLDEEDVATADHVANYEDDQY